MNTWAVINDYIVYTVKRPQPLSTKVTTRNYNMQSRSSLYADVMNHVEEMEVEENLDTPDRYVFTCFVQVHAPVDVKLYKMEFALFFIMYELLKSFI